MFRKKEKGFFLLVELLIVIGLASAAFAIWAQHSKDELYKAQADAAGVKLSAIADGLRGYLSENRTTLVSTTAVVTKTDVNFLKSNGCGGTLVNGFLPCAFNKNLPLYLTSLNIRIGRESVITGAGSANIAVAEIKIGPNVKDDPLAVNPRIDLTEEIISKAKSAAPVMASPVGATTYTDWSYDTVTTSPTFGQIKGLVNTVANNGPWLRVDGGNQMVGNLKVGPSVGTVNDTLATNGSITTVGNITTTGIVNGADVQTANGRTLQTSVVRQDVVQMSNLDPTGKILNKFAYSNISTVGIVCDGARALKIFASAPYLTNDDVFNGKSVTATKQPTYFQVRVQVHTAVGWVSPKDPAYLSYSLRCI